MPTSRPILALVVLLAACPKPRPEDALAVSRDVAQALSDAYTEWFVRELERADESRLEELTRIEREYLRLMDGYRSAATAAYLAIRRGQTTSGDLDQALAQVLGLFRRCGIVVPAGLP